MILRLAHAGDVQNRPAQAFRQSAISEQRQRHQAALAHISAVVVRDVSKDSVTFAVTRTQAFYASALRRMRGHP